MRMSSMASLYKAFSSCGAHLCVVSLYFEIWLRVYLSSSLTHSSQDEMTASVMYTVVTPMLNLFTPMQNKDVKGTLKRLIKRPVTVLLE
jgi:olfactory receptor